MGYGKMKKSDLKTGYLLETRNKTKLTVMLGTGKGDILLNECGTYYNINEISNDLFDIDLRDYDIMKVYRPKVKMVLFDVEEYKLIWQRKEDKLDIINDIVDELCERYKVKARQVYYELPNFGKAVIKLTLENDYLINIDIDKQLLEAIEEKEIKLRINTMFVEEFCRLALKEVEK